MFQNHDCEKQTKILELTNQSWNIGKRTHSKERVIRACNRGRLNIKLSQLKFECRWRARAFTSVTRPKVKTFAVIVAQTLSQNKRYQIVPFAANLKK